MFERFTDRARRVVVLAQEEARMADVGIIGTEHVLLALIREGEGVAARVLIQDLQLNPDKLKEMVTARAVIEQPPPGTTPTTTGHIPFSLRAKKILQFSLRESLQLGHNYIDTEHLLLGLLREPEGQAGQLLRELGVELTDVRHKVIQRLSGYQGKQAAETPSVPQAQIKTDLQKALHEDFKELSKAYAEAYGPRLKVRLVPINAEELDIPVERADHRMDQVPFPGDEIVVNTEPSSELTFDYQVVRRQFQLRHPDVDVVLYVRARADFPG